MSSLPEPHGSSFDLRFARELSQRLSRHGEPEPRNAPADAPPDYTPFSAAKVLGEREPGSTPAAVAVAAGTTVQTPIEPKRPDAPDLSAGMWNEMLDWFLVAAQAHACFVLDRHGLVVAHRGTRLDNLDAIGSRIILAIEQAIQMQPPGATGATVAIEIGALSWLTGLQFPMPSAGGLTVCVWSDEYLDRTLRGRLAPALARVAGEV